MMKKYNIMIQLCLILCFLVGCGDRGPIEKMKALKARAVLEANNRELVIQYIDALNAGDFEAFKEVLAPNYAIYSPSGYPQPTSREKLIENYEGVRDAFSEFLWNIEDIIAADDKVICRIIVSGALKGGAANLPENKTAFRLSLITIIRIEDGKIVEEWQEDDQLGFARQMGMELRPKAEGK